MNKLFVFSVMTLVIGPLSFFTPANAQSKDSDRVDLGVIEKEFWSAKDTDFSVVQNRTFPKENRFFLSLGMGTLMNDPFITAQITRLSTGYYFSERWGVELASETLAPSDSKSTQYFKSQGQFPNYNLSSGYQSIGVSWVPLYAKMSFLDRAILYFDMQFSFGVGQKSYQIFHQTGGNAQDSSMGYHFDITQNIFFSKNWSLRIDLKNQWSNQNRHKSDTFLPLGSESVNDSSLLFGITYFH